MNNQDESLDEKSTKKTAQLIQKIVKIDEQNGPHFPENKDKYSFFVYLPFDFENLTNVDSSLSREQRQFKLAMLERTYRTNKEYFGKLINTMLTRKEIKAENERQNDILDDVTKQVLTACSACYEWRDGKVFVEEQISKEIIENILMIRFIATAICAETIREIDRMEVLLYEWLVFHSEACIFLAKKYFDTYLDSSLDWDGDSFDYEDESDQAMQFMTLICAIMSGISEMCAAIDSQNYKVLAQCVENFVPEKLIKQHEIMAESSDQDDYIN